MTEITETSSPHRSRWSPVEGQAAVDAWRSSGLSRKAWCAQAGVGLHRLQYWCHRTAQPHDLDLDFVQIEMPTPASSALTVCLGHTIRIEVQRGFDPAVLQSVVEALS